MQNVMRTVAIIEMILALPALALAQPVPPAPPSANASYSFTGQLAAMVAQLMDERDQGLKQIAELRKELDAAKPPTPSESPK